MSNKRFWISVVTVWFCLFLTDWVLHGIWLQPLYMATAQFWRTEADMQSMMPWMWLGHFVFAWAFVWIYSNGINKTNQWGQAFRYGLAVLALAKIPGQFIMWATVPYPSELIFKWFVIAAIQAWSCAFVMTWTFKPMTWTSKQKT